MAKEVNPMNRYKCYFKFTATSMLLLAFLLFSGCSRKQGQETPPGPSIEKAIAVLHPTEGSTVRGIVTFSAVEGGIQIVADVDGLAPGKHGFHIHEFGDCSGPDGKTAGGHFNPENAPHGGPESPQRHVGDLGNLTADESGHAHYERVDNLIAFSGSHSIIGRAVIIHQDEDDLQSQPTGAAGARLACGVIGIAKP